MAEIAALHPADAIEGELAVQVVAAGAWAKDCLRLARDTAATSPRPSAAVPRR